MSTLPVLRGVDRRPLKGDEAVTVTARAQAGDHAAQMRMIGAVAGIILQTIRAITRKNPRQETEDLFNEAALYLITHAIPKFRPDRSLWNTYAGWWIRARVWRAAADNSTIRIPSGALERARRDGTMARMVTLANPASLDIAHEAHDTSRWNLHDVLTDEEDADLEEATIETEQRHRVVAVAMRTGEARNTYTMLLRMAGRTLDDVGRRLGVSRERARHYEAFAFGNVLDHLAFWPTIRIGECPGWHAPCGAPAELEVGVCVPCFRALELAAGTLTSELAPIVARTA